MDALRGALAAGLLPWPQTRARLALLLASSLAAHMAAVAALPALMSGVSPGAAARQSPVIRVSLRPFTASANALPPDARPSEPMAAPSPSPAMSDATSSSSRVSRPAPAPEARPAVPTPPTTAAPAAAPAASTGPTPSPTPRAGPPIRTPVLDLRPRQGSELAARDADGLISGPRYLQLKEVDQRPAPITHINPVYPPEAGQREGRVVVRLLISENGAIDRIEILSADPPGFFERPTLEAFGNARYQPALKSNVRVRSQMTFEVKFLRDDSVPSPDRLPPPIPTGPPKAGG